METKEITIVEGNKLIAEFMKGVTIHNGGRIRGRKTVWDARELQYHRDWNWLMPVVEKIETSQKDTSHTFYKRFTFQITGQYCMIQCHYDESQPGVVYQSPWGCEPGPKIKEVWKAVVAFIEWFLYDRVIRVVMIGGIHEGKTPKIEENPQP